MIGARKLALLAVAAAFAPVASAAAAGDTAQIVGGTAAPAGAWPSIALLEGHFDDPGGQQHVYRCTGSVVAPTWIITAAHCAFGNPGEPPDSMVAKLGVTDYDDPSGELLTVDRFVPDPSYDTERDLDDVALLHLQSATSVPAMRLATSDESTAGRYVSNPGVPNAAGWGAVDEDGKKFTTALQQAYLQIKSAPDCRDLIPGFDSATQACAGTTGRAGVCFGDSGGPLVKFDAGTHEPVLWGVTSSRPESGDGEAACSLSEPAQFTWVPAFADFIQSTLATAANPAPVPAVDTNNDEGGDSIPPTPATPTSTTTPPPAGCRHAQKTLTVARKTERRALQRLRAARRDQVRGAARGRVSHRYDAAHSRRVLAAAIARRACRPTA